jgi:hypothetical protein
MSNLTANPPVDSINGAWYINGSIIYGTNGINMTSPPGLFTFDPTTNLSKPLLNNYRGLRFATPDDPLLIRTATFCLPMLPSPTYDSALVFANNNRLMTLSHILPRCPPGSGPSILQLES